MLTSHSIYSVALFLGYITTLASIVVFPLWLFSLKFSAFEKVCFENEVHTMIAFSFVYLRFCFEHVLNQWFSKWSISTPRGQLDHPRGR